jgi:pyrroline-5-carboxylate reductase
MPTKPSILIIGGGHMGGALALRWKQVGYPVTVVERDVARHAFFSTHTIPCVAALAHVTTPFTIMVLAVKPQQFSELLSELTQNTTQSGAIILSIMAGISLAALQKISPNAVRIMPNLPVTVGEGMSVGFTTSPDASMRAIVQELFAAIGDFAWIEDEALLHAVTAISGSGPGYVFAFMEAIEEAAKTLGLTPALAHQLTCQTLRGTALLAAQSEASPSLLRAQVTSPGGTTEAALSTFTQQGFAHVILEGIRAATARSKALSE